MTAGISMQGADVARVADDAVELHDRLRAQRVALRTDAADLLAGGWHGPAATRYSGAWSDCDLAAERVLASLRALAAATALAGLELGAADAAAGSATAYLRARLECVR